MVVVDETELRHPAPAPQRAGDGLEDRTRGRARVLRIERQDDDPPNVVCVKFLQRGSDRPRLAGEIRRRLDGYRNRRPYRQ